ncbi:uncharacterized protein LOC111411301 [Olea europaea var. sylvestris]|uniref:uncharacterized protein LOC111411301 n=1 Tax=Olea europaea var. sylvestris TaxID=158386 RepID=UPI000C1D83BD|nr:uncharacterized protein LOC111411301 [Olea europaea var. sylvestris]
MCEIMSFPLKTTIVELYSLWSSGDSTIGNSGNRACLNIIPMGKRDYQNSIACTFMQKLSNNFQSTIGISYESFYGRKYQSPIHRNKVGEKRVLGSEVIEWTIQAIDKIIASKKMMDETELWENMRKEGLFPDSQTYAEVIRGFLAYGSPADAMNIFEDMKKSPDPPEDLPFRILLKGLLPHPLLRNRVKQNFEEIFPDQRVYDPPEEIFGLR